MNKWISKLFRKTNTNNPKEIISIKIEGIDDDIVTISLRLRGDTYWHFIDNINIPINNTLSISEGEKQSELVTQIPRGKRIDSWIVEHGKL